MVNKPRRRKQGGHGRTYLVLGIILVLVVASVSYAYAVGFGPFNRQSTSTTTTVPLFYARINTTLGSFEVELFNSAAPKTVANFVSLVDSGFYTNLTWHRIEKGFVIQVGDPTTKNGGGNRSTWGESSSPTQIPFENTPYDNYIGYLAMASTAQGVGGTSQFFINLANNTNLDGSYAVFGKVIGNGMSVVDVISNVPTEPVVTGGITIDEPKAPVLINSITMINQP